MFEHHPYSKPEGERAEPLRSPTKYADTPWKELEEHSTIEGITKCFMIISAERLDNAVDALRESNVTHPNKDRIMDGMRMSAEYMRNIVHHEGFIRDVVNKPLVREHVIGLCKNILAEAWNDIEMIRTYEVAKTLRNLGVPRGQMD